MAERLWMATNKSGGCYWYSSRPLHSANGSFTPGAGVFGKAVYDDEANAPPPGEVWEYVRTDCVDTESGALAAAKAEIDRLKAELAEAKKMPECVEKLLQHCEEKATDLSGPRSESLGARSAAVRRHYATPLTLSVGEWGLSDGTTCRVFSDGTQFLARVNGETGFHDIEPNGQLRDRKAWLVKRTGE